MVSSHVINPVYDIRASSVTTSRLTGDDKCHELSPMDLAMKLHYIKAVYFFRSEAVQGIDIYALKEHMFEWLSLFYPTAGRIRRSENGRHVIKCNDAGVRILEAKCQTSIDEWLRLEDRTVDDQLVPNQVLGPELGFSPLVYMQFTWFTCGGISMGLNWAHVLGDPFTAIAFINRWAQMMAKYKTPRQQSPRQHLTCPNTQNRKKSQTEQRSSKTIGSVGDTWQIPNTRKMETFCFLIKEKVLQKAEKQKIFPFLTSLFWKSISKIKETEIKVITICSQGSKPIENKIPNNTQGIGIVEANFNIQEANLSDLAKFIEEKMVDERSLIEGYVEKNSDKSNFILYGANLTFINLEGGNMYDMEIKGKKPVFANLTVAGIEEEGVILVFPKRPESGGGGRMVTVILPENQISDLKNVLRKEWGIY